MRNVDVDGSPAGGSIDAAGGPALAGTAAAAGVGAGAAGFAAGRSRSSRSSNDSHPFSSDEATRMADAFRNALRKPEFPASAFGSDNNSPNEKEDELGSSMAADPTPNSLIRDELASEGKNLRSVERGRPKVMDE
jgi:hypothetical protein